MSLLTYLNFFFLHYWHSVSFTKWKYTKQKKYRANRQQHNTDDGGQAMGAEMRHVQMSRWCSHIGEEGKQQ